VTAKSKQIVSGKDWRLVGRALADLQSRAFDLAEVKASLRRLRNRMVDPADRNGEPGESDGEPIGPSAGGDVSPGVLTSSKQGWRFSLTLSCLLSRRSKFLPFHIALWDRD
jgi:hypothetical protein